jgi:hypothetical protein
VNPLELDAARYLVAPRGNTQWAKNLRANPAGRLLLGRRVEPFTAAEVPDADKVPILRDYLRRWRWEVGTFFDVGANASDDELARIAPDHPVFRIDEATEAEGA